MQQIQYSLFELIISADKMLNSNIFYNSFSDENIKLDTHCLKLEEGCYAFKAEVYAYSKIKFIQNADEENSLFAIGYTSSTFNSAKKHHCEGIYMGSNNNVRYFYADANDKFSIYVMVFDKKFAQRYNFQEILPQIKQDEKESFIYRKIDSLSNKIVNSFINKKGLIYRKRSSINLLNILKFYITNQEESLKNHIARICNTCMVNQEQLNNLISVEFSLDPNVSEELFYEVFGISSSVYYLKYKLHAVQKFIKYNQNSLDTFLLNNIRKSDCVEECAKQFDVSVKTFNNVFLDQKGESIHDYKRRLRLLSRTTSVMYLN